MSHGNEEADVLIEKPLFPTLVDFESLPDTELRRIFLNLEFYNAYFISDFFDETKLLDLDKIEITWHDPLMENRGSEERNAQKYSLHFSRPIAPRYINIQSPENEDGEFQNLQHRI